MALITELNPPPETIASIRETLLRHNAELIPGYAYADFLIREATADDRMAGSLLAQIGGGWLYIDSLWVTEQERRKGIGTRLLEKAEAIAIERGCHSAYLYTYSFQSPGFYEKAGYQVFGSLEDFCGSQSKFFMKKRLA